MLHLKLGMYLAEPVLGMVREPNGPLFHQWLPNGEQDAVHFTFPDPRNSLRVWFLRRGFMDRDWVTYAGDRFEVDETAMRRQGWLDAGPLRGEGTYCYVSSSEMTALRENQQASDEYLAVAKRVVDFLLPPIQGLVDTLRLQYGQYWLAELRPWDSRTGSLGGYCQGVFHLQWRESLSAEWRPFLPDVPEHIVQVGGPGRRRYAEFLTQEDWSRIKETLSRGSVDHPLALRVAARAHELSDRGFFAEAYIQGATALELALEHYIATRAKSFAAIGETAASMFENQSLTQQLSLVAVTTGLITPSLLESACRAVDTRNKIVHEAAAAVDHLHDEDLQSLLGCVQALLGMDELKCPRLTNSNELAAPEESTT